MIDPSSAPRSFGTIAALRVLTTPAVGTVRAGKRKAVDVEASPSTPARSPSPMATDLSDSDDDADDFDAAAARSGGQGMPIDKQGAIAVRASRTAPVEVAGAMSTASRAPIPDIPLIPRDLDIKVLQRFPARDPKQPHLIDWRFAFRLPGPGDRRDQTRCDPKCRFVRTSFSAHFKAMTANLKGADAVDRILAKLSESTSKEYVAMIANDTPPSLTHYLNTAIEKRHCQGTKLFGLLKQHDPEPLGVTLADYDDQGTWQRVIVCANIAIPPGADAKQAYRNNIGTRALDDYAIRVKSEPQGPQSTSPFDDVSDTDSDTDLDDDEHDFSHAALYGCGIAQLFNSGLSDGQAHLTFANSYDYVADPDGTIHKLIMPKVVPINRVPPGKQLLAWYGQGWFDSRAAEAQATSLDAAAAHIDIDDEDIDMAGALTEVVEAQASVEPEANEGAAPIAGAHRRWYSERVEAFPHESDRQQIGRMIAAMDTAFPNSRIPKSGPLHDARLMMVRNHIMRTLDFVETLDQPLRDWLRSHDPGHDFTETERVDKLLDVVVNAGSMQGSSRSAASSYIWRLRPLMQSLVGCQLRIDPGRTPLPKGLRLKLDEIDPCNRMEMIQLKADAMSQIPAGQPQHRLIRERTHSTQINVINPAHRLLKWLGTRSAREWVGEHIAIPASGASEESVSALVQRLFDDGYDPHRTVVNATRPLLRQLLDLPIDRVTAKITPGPLDSQLTQLSDKSFDATQWTKEIQGFEQLPDDRARALLMKFWGDGMATVDRVRKGSSKWREVKTQKRVHTRKAVRAGCTLYAHWHESGTIERWLAQVDTSVDRSIDSRWLTVRAALSKELPALSRPELSAAKPLLMTLLQVLDEASAEA